MSNISLKSIYTSIIVFMATLLYSKETGVFYWSIYLFIFVSFNFFLLCQSLAANSLLKRSYCCINTLQKETCFLLCLWFFSPLCDMAQGCRAKWLWQIGIGNDKIGYLISMAEGIGLWCQVHSNKQTVWTPPGLVLMAAFIHLMGRFWLWKMAPDMSPCPRYMCYEHCLFVHRDSFEWMQNQCIPL